MFDLLKIVISFVLTGFVGVFVSYYFQRKNSLSQLSFKLAERKAGELKDIRDKFEQLSAERIYQAKNMIISIRKDTLTEKDRELYMDSVRNWNKSLNVIYFDLRSQGLYPVTLQVEEVQVKFRSAHLEIKSEIDKKISLPSSLEAAMTSIESAYARSCDISKLLTETSDFRWAEVKNVDTVELTPWNLNKASTLTLIVALFHKTPSSLRISRSRVDI